VILLEATPAQWVEDALEHWRTLLNDHANCEKKAASTALAFMFAYPEDRELVLAMSRLAREELRHFEQVQRAMRALGVKYERQRPSQYAQALRRPLRSADPGRKLDLLLAGALIEARSAERFALLAPRLPPPLSRLYADLGASEARHYEMYTAFAEARDPQGWRARLEELARCEAQAAVLPGSELRFHSGPLARTPV
jgi:tRNA-(ms[2]io[6]A)-hydroxylase